MDQLILFRHRLDEFMARHPQSPLDDEQQAAFSALDYFDGDAAFVFREPIEHLPDDEPLIEMQTTTGETRLFRRWARFAFLAEGEAVSVIIYADPHGHDLFLPFRDATNGVETYGAGRYLDSQRPGLALLNGDMMEVDFNYAYNPYCAYNEAFSCPLPPRENWLPVAIRAGEKTFHPHPNP